MVLYASPALVLIAFVLTLLHGVGKPMPLWIPLMLLCIALLITVVVR